MPRAAAVKVTPRGATGATASPSDGAFGVQPAVPEDEVKLRQRLVKLWVQLDAEYATWRRTQEDIIDYEQPGHGQFYATETNRGDRKDVHVLNNTAGDRLRKLSAAMDTGICSEAREWFTVSLLDALAAEKPGNREYCHDYQSALFNFIAKVGFYAPNRNALDDVCGPATGLVLIEEDEDNFARCTHVPIGQFRLGSDSSGEVNLVARRFIYTAAQMMQEFGEEKVSAQVRNAMAQEITQTAKFQVLHVIEQRRKGQRGPFAKDMPWASYWMEMGAGFWGVNIMGQAQSEDALGPVGILRESGYHERPFYVLRWNVIGQDAYGKDSPGWTVLGDTKELQDVEFGHATMFALVTKPPLNVPDGLKNASLLPDARNAIPSDAKLAAHPTIEIEGQTLDQAQRKIDKLEARITNGCFGDVLFLLSADQHAQPRTAEEIRGKKEERLLQLGGVFARIARELRSALVRFASIAHRRGLLPEPPPELVRGDQKLKIDFVNPLVTAQKAIGVTAIGQLVSFGLAAAQAKQGGFDKLDLDEATDSVCDMLGVKPNILLSDEEVAKRRAAAAQAANAQKQAESMPQAADAIKKLSDSDPENLRSILSRFGPEAQAQGAGPGA